MEVGSVSSAETNLWACSVIEAMAVETALAAWKSLACLLFMVLHLSLPFFVIH